MKKIILLLLIIVSFACNKKKEVANLIDGGYYKYWKEVYKPNPLEPGTVICYFDKNGMRDEFYRYPSGYFVRNSIPDVMYVQKWEMIDDTTAYIGCSDCIIETINDSVFIYTEKLRKCRHVLVKAPDSLIPWEYRRILFQ